MSTEKETKAQEEEKKEILDIKVFMYNNGEVGSYIGVNVGFLKLLKQNEVDRVWFLRELIERLNGYIDGVE